MQAPTALLGGRYRYSSPVKAALKAPTWLAIDLQTNSEVVASALPTGRVAALMGVVGLKHPHLAAILQVVDTPDPAALPEGTPEGAAVVVAEHVQGRTLHQYLKTSRMTPAEAVTLWLRLCQAAATLHASGGAHGAISPRSILLEPKDGRSGPVLTQLLAATSGAYCAPERLQGRGPSSSDDTWALHAALFAALTGVPPYRGETKDQLLQSIVSGQLQRLADFGVGDESLHDLLQSGLVANLARRRTTVEQLVESLETWEPAPLSAAASEWEEDAATVVGDDSEAMAALMRQPAPGESLPPVPLGDDDDGPTLAEPPKRPPLPRPGKPAAVPRAAPAPPRPKAPPAPTPAAHQPEPPAPEPEPGWQAPEPEPAAPAAFSPEPVVATQPLATQPLATEPLATEPLAMEPPAAEAPAEAPVPQPYDEPNPYDDEDDATTIMGGEPLADIRRVLAGDSDAPPPAPPAAMPAAEQPPAGGMPLAYPQTPFDATPPPPPAPYGGPFDPSQAGAQPGYPPAGYSPDAQQPAVYPGPGFPPADAGPYLPSVPAPPMDLQVGPIDENEIRKASRGPLIALGVIVAVLVLAIAVLLFLNSRGLITLSPAAEPPASALASGAAAHDGSASAASLAAPPPARAPSAVDAATGEAPAPAPAPQPPGRCVASHFEPDTLKGTESLPFLCQDTDMRGINSQLYRLLVVAGVGKVTTGMREWSTLGWFELGVTAAVRSACCPPDTKAPKLPTTAPGCDQLSDVLAKVAASPITTSEAATRARTFEDSVVCFYRKGIPRPYNYMGRPTAQGRATFTAFLERAARRSKT